MRAFPATAEKDSFSGAARALKTTQPTIGRRISGLEEGLGIAVLPEALCDPEPTFERILPDLPPFQFPVWLVTHRELQTSRRIRIVFDQLVRGFREMDRLVRS